MTRAAVYLRISQDPTGEQAGVTRQREDCLALVEQQDWELHEVYQDNDISASSGAARPAYQRLLADVRNGLIDAIVSWHPDRLYRKLKNLEELIEAVERQNVIMRTVRAGEIDLSTPTGRMLARILSATAQAEGEVKADRWARSWRQGREQGLYAKTGSRLFGYTHEGELIPEEAEIVRRIAKDFLSGRSLLSICNDLDREGIKATRGNAWRTQGLKQYLLNPRIAGYSTLKGEIVGEGDWEPILDRDTWETIRALLQSRTKPTPVRVALLGGLLFCGKCGHRLITGQTRGRRTYLCPNRPAMRGCGGVSGFAEPIEEVVEAAARERLDDPRIWQRLADMRSTSGAPALLQEITGLEARLVELEQQLDEPGVPVETIMRAMSRAQERLGECQAALADIASRAVPTPFVGGAEWPADLEGRRKLVALALGDQRVYLDPARPNQPRRFDETRVRISE